MFHQKSVTPLSGGGKNEANLYIDPKDMKNWQFVCSVYPGQFNVSTAHGDFVIPPKPDNKPYSYIRVPPGWTKRDHGDGQFQNDMNIPARDVAADVTSGLEDRGVFIPQGEIATAEEVAAAVQRRNARWITKDVPEADIQWSRRQDPSRIDDNAKMAARVLGLKKPWAGYTEMSDTEPCPDCKESIKLGARVCKHCGAQGIVWDGRIATKPEPQAASGGRR
jgi:hypothetical protein